MSANEAHVRAYVSVVAAGAALALVVSVAVLARDTMLGGPFAISWVQALVAVGILGGFVLLRRHPFTFHWRDHRIVVSLDEGGILIGLLVLPAPLIALIVTLSGSLVQMWGGPREWIKRVFNVAQYALAAVLSGALFVALERGGMPNVLAASLAGVFFGAMANYLLAGVFASLSGTGWVTVFRERFLLQGANSAVIGIAGGLTLVALWHLHPLATLAALPFGYLVRSYWRLYASADRELDVHRHLANATHDLVGTANVNAVAERVIGECERLLDCGRAELALDGRAPFARAFSSGPRRNSLPIVEPLPARDGGVLGGLRVWPREGKDLFGEQERALLKTIAGQAASAIENARAIERLDTYLSTAQDAVLLVETDHRVRYMNPAARRLFGVAEGQPVRATDFFRGEDLARLSGMTAGDAALLEAEATDLTKSRRYLVETHAGPVVEGDRVTGVVMVVRDVTERKRLEDEMSKQRDALAQSEKLSALGTMIAGVAHEINNPLTYMRGNLQLSEMSINDRLADPNVSDDEKAFLAEIVAELKVVLEGSDRITHIAQSLKNVSKRGTGERRAEEMNRIVNEVVTVVKTGIPRTVKLEVDLSSAPTTVFVRPSEIHQVVLNLIKNAAEALEGKADARVRVRTFCEGDQVILAVEDNGPGIPEETQKKLFTPFFTTKEKGTGLGLSISERIVRAHDGEMKLKSAVGNGTTFTIRLPAHKVEVAAPEPLSS